MIRRGERRLAAQPLGDDDVGLRHPQHHQRAAEAIDVRRLPRLAGDEILGNDARFGGLTGREVGVGRAAPAPRTSASRGRRRRRPRPASAAPGCAPGTRRRTPAARRRPVLEFRRRDRRVDRRIDTDERRHPGSIRSSDQPSSTTSSRASGLEREQLRKHLARRGRSPPRSSISASAISSAGSSPARLAIEISAGGLDIARGRGRPSPAVARPSTSAGLRRTASRSASSASASRPFSSRSAWSSRNRAAGPVRVAHLREHARGSESARRNRPGRSTRAGRRSRRRRARRRARGAACDGAVVRLGVGQQPLPRRDVGELQLRCFVVRNELQDLLVEGRGLRVEAVVEEMLGDAGVLRDRLVRLVRRGRRGRRACWRCSSRAAGPRRRGRTPRWRRRGAPGGAASPPFSACLHDRGPRRFSTGTRGDAGAAHPSYQTGRAAGTSADARRSSRTARRRRDGRASRSPCAGRSRSADRCACSSSIIRSRVTLATIDAAAIAVHRASPCITARCAISRSGMRNASTSTKSGSGTSCRTRAASPAATPDGC